MLEVFAQLGEIYLVRTAYDGVTSAVRRIRDCLAIYHAIRAGSRPGCRRRGDDVGRRRSTT